MNLFKNETLQYKYNTEYKTQDTGMPIDKDEVDKLICSIFEMRSLLQPKFKTIVVGIEASFRTHQRVSDRQLSTLRSIERVLKEIRTTASKWDNPKTNDEHTDWGYIFGDKPDAAK